MTQRNFDPVLIGSDLKAWQTVDTFYKIAASSTDLDLAANLRVPPFPTDFQPYESVVVSGNGRPIQLGWPSATWAWEWLDPETMATIRAAVDTAQAGSGLVYIQTATDKVIQTSSNNWQYYRYDYRKFSGYVSEFTFTRVPQYRFSNVNIKFTHLTQLN